MNSNPRSELTSLAERYARRYQDEQTSLAPLRIQLAAQQDLLCRDTLPGHITVSSIVVHRNKILMIFHPYLKKWLQPGGHVESGECLLETAQRELLEETGIAGKIHAWHQQNPIPIDIGIHRIPANPKKAEPEHQHYDFRYVFVVGEISTEPSTCEHSIAWTNIHDIAETDLNRLIAKLQSENIAIS